MNLEMHGLPAAEEIEQDHPGWQAWASLNGQWHARLRGSVPIVMVHDDSPSGIRQQIERIERGTHE